MNLKKLKSIQTGLPNLVAAMGAAIGLLNVWLAWRLLGVSSAADSWMLSVALVQSIALLSQLGVEQVSVFIAHYTLGVCRDRFNNDCRAWSFIFGCVFVFVVYLLIPIVVPVFGFGANDQQIMVVELTRLMLFQIMLSPALYVIRQQLLSNGDVVEGTAVGYVFSFGYFVALILFWLLGSSDVHLLGQICGAIYALVFLVFFFLFIGPRISISDWGGVHRLFVSSAKFRGAHSIHNFLIVLISNSVISGLGGGAVSTYQYAKRLSDGVVSIAIGPHLASYHAKQAASWVARDRDAFLSNAKVYIQTAIPIALMLSVAVFGVLFFVDKINSYVFCIFALMLAWQFVISMESVFISVVNQVGAAFILVLINLVFIINFLLITRLEAINGVAWVVSSLVCCQIVSTLLFFFFARHFFMEHFYRRRYARD